MYTSQVASIYFGKGRLRAAAIAPWFRLRLPSCGRGFESQAHQVLSIRIFEIIVMRKGRK